MFFKRRSENLEFFWELPNSYGPSQSGFAAASLQLGPCGLSLVFLGCLKAVKFNKLLRSGHMGSNEV